jgi:type IV secretion system protein VirD4
MSDAPAAAGGEVGGLPGAETTSGIYLGRHYDDQTQAEGKRLIYGDDRHLLLFGPTSTGKTTRFLMVNLLSDTLNDRSVIVIDPKAELAAVCAKYRHELGHDVKILDPFGKLREIVEAKPELYRYLIVNNLVESAGFNPLSMLDPDSENFYDDAAGLGEALIKIEGKEPHWSESAQGLVTGLIMWEKLRNPGSANLHNVRMLVTEADEFKEITGPDGKTETEQVRGLAVSARNMVAVGEEESNADRGGPEIASLAGRFTRRSRELFSIQSTADTQTRWILSKRMRADLRKDGGINFRSLKEKPTTVFVILPAERMRTHSVWLRLVIVSALRSLYRVGGLRTLMLIDEMVTLGHLGPLEDAFGLVRGYRVQIAGYLQDLAQLKALYDQRWESFLANAGVVQGLAPNDLTTADWMSRRSGERVVVTRSIGESTGTGSSGPNVGANTGLQEIMKPRWTQYELMGLARGTGVLWLAGLSHSSRFVAPPYYRIETCTRRALPNPYHDA